MAKTTHRQIYKIQRPIMTTDPEPMALVYNQDRKHTFELDLDRNLTRFMGNNLKVYVYGWYENDQFHYERIRLPNPGW